MNFVFEPVNLDWVNMPDSCNSHNHCDLNDDKEYEKYNKKIIQTNKDKWINEFPDPEGSFAYIFDNNDIKNLLSLSQEYIITHETSIKSIIYFELLKKMPVIDKKYFIRTDTCSLKDGFFGNIAYDDNDKILLSLITSKRINYVLNMCIENNIDNLSLYYVPWRNDFDQKNEFRVFIYNNKVTCISQYIWFENLNVENNIQQYVQYILDFCENNISKFNKIMKNIIVDVIVIDNSENITVELIELGPFGKKYSVGSCLFHWINDNDKIKNNDDLIYVRYVTY
ncbi:hypothetical protein Hokovirus_1_185 [Hokovirus HKV1]|uniref:Uncharacterized protein n=1 Tax=Hokovirus HKV1 TaxID=1977638 RepID=A0A1V0SF14_9VIRU|nr:hypothetical protein Hokovirus_1_185 [Hokovirus HKV1]